MVERFIKGLCSKYGVKEDIEYIKRNKYREVIIKLVNEIVSYY